MPLSPEEQEFVQEAISKNIPRAEIEKYLSEKRTAKPLVPENAGIKQGGTDYSFSGIAGRFGRGAKDAVANLPGNIKDVGSLAFQLADRRNPEAQGAAWETVKQIPGLMKESVQRSIDDPLGDPFETVSNLSLGLGGLGGILKGASKVGSLAGKASVASKLNKAGNAAAILSRGSDPLWMAQRAASVLPSAALEKMGRGLGRHSLGFLKHDVPVGYRRDNALETMLEEGLPIHPLSLQRGRRLMNKTNTEIEDSLAKSGAAGQTIHPKKILDTMLEEVSKEKGYRFNLDTHQYPGPTGGEDDMRRIMAKANEFRIQNQQPATPVLNSKGKTIAMTPPRWIERDAKWMNEIKRNNYEKLGDNYFANEAAKKAPENVAVEGIDRAIKNELEALIPGIGKKNERYGALKDLNKAIEHKIDLGDRAKMFDLGKFPALAGLSMALTGQPSVVAGALAALRLLDYPAIGSTTAIAAYKGGKGITKAAKSKTLKGTLNTSYLLQNINKSRDPEDE